MMIPKTSLPLWVTQLLLGYVVPSTVEATTKIVIGSLVGPKGLKEVSGMAGTLYYPGLVPDFSVAAVIDPGFGGLDYKIILKKAVGFYGVSFYASEYDSKKFNKWTFPVTRLNFGYMAFLSTDSVVSASSIHYEKQRILCNDVMTALTPVMLQHESDDVLVDADVHCCTSIAYQLAVPMTCRFSFHPVYERWQIKWFEETPDEPDPSGMTCEEALAFWEAAGSPSLPTTDPLFIRLQACFES